MIRKITHIITSLLVVLGMLAAATPAFADNKKGGNVNGLILSVDTAANTITITPKNGAAGVTINVDISTQIKRLGKTAILADLQIGDKLEAKYNAVTMLASKIEATVTMAELHGTIKSVDATAGTVTITKSGDPLDVTLNVDISTQIKRLGKTATLADLQIGDKVEAKYNAVTMLASKIEASVTMAELHGTIKSVDATAGTVTITKSGTALDVTLNVDISTQIKRLGKTATLADLQIGDKLEAKYNAVTMLASKIKAR